MAAGGFAGDFIEFGQDVGGIVLWIEVEQRFAPGQSRMHVSDIFPNQAHSRLAVLVELPGPDVRQEQRMFLWPNIQRRGQKPIRCYPSPRRKEAQDAFIDDVLAEL